MLIGNDVVMNNFNVLFHNFPEKIEENLTNPQDIWAENQT
jgi:hypothetical protein